MSDPIDLVFLGSGNAFGPQGRAFSSFLLNEHYLFDCGPTVLQQLSKAEIESDQIDCVFITHFHGDHFFGLPFLFLDCWHKGRSKDLIVVGPPGVEQRAEQLFELAYGGLPPKATSYQRRYVEVSDGMEAEIAGLQFTALKVDHVPDLECYGFRARVDDRWLVYSGDARLSGSLMNLARGADVLVLECSCVDEEVHLGPQAVAQVARQAKPGSSTIVTHLDGREHPNNFEGLLVASDLAKFSF